MKQVCITHIPGRNIEVPSIIGGTSTDTPLVGEFFPTPYPNIAICAQKNSGKSTLIYNIIKRIIGKDPMRKVKFMLFNPNIEKDIIWVNITSMIDKSGHKYIATNSFLVDKSTTSSGKLDQGNLLRELENELPKDGSGPPMVVVYDDLCNSLRNNYLGKLLSRNRHSRIMNILSVQNSTDLFPGMWNQIDYAILMGNIPKKRLGKLYDQMSISVDEPLFKGIYDYATAERFGFLWIDKKNDSFRKNFSEEIEIKNMEEE